MSGVYSNKNKNCINDEALKYEITSGHGKVVQPSKTIHDIYRLSMEQSAKMRSREPPVVVDLHRDTINHGLYRHHTVHAYEPQEFNPNHVGGRMNPMNLGHSLEAIHDPMAQHKYSPINDDNIDEDQKIMQDKVGHPHTRRYHPVLMASDEPAGKRTAAWLVFLTMCVGIAIGYIRKMK